MKTWAEMRDAPLQKLEKMRKGFLKNIQRKHDPTHATLPGF